MLLSISPNSTFQLSVCRQAGMQTCDFMPNISELRDLQLLDSSNNMAGLSLTAAHSQLWYSNTAHTHYSVPDALQLLCVQCYTLQYISNSFSNDK